MTTPPPPQGNPYAQGQQPQGQNPFAQGQNPYAQGQPPQPGHPQQGAPFGPVPPEQPRRRMGFKKIKNIVVGVVVAGVVIGGFIASRDDANNASVGDCMSISNPNSVTDPDLEVVDCGDAKAQYKVAEKKDGTSEGCDRTKYSEYTETGGSSDFTLCLEELSTQ